MDSNKGFFGSPKYEVPLDKLYLCSINSKRMSWSGDSEDDFGLGSYPHPNADTGNMRNDTDSSSSEDDIAIPGAVNQPHFSDDDSRHVLDNPVQRRSSRIRNRPDRLNSVNYDSDAPFHGESDTVQNWWPNYPQGSWSPNIDSL